jgi:hypothetical protein
VDFAWEKLQNPLHFVQRGRILLRCGSAFALSLPSLGVSSLDLGRLFTQAALFSHVGESRNLTLSFRDGPTELGFTRVQRYHLSKSAKADLDAPDPESRDSGFARSLSLGRRRAPTRRRALSDKRYALARGMTEGVIPRRPGTVRGRQAERRPARRPGERNPWPPAQTVALVRVAVRPYRSRG